MNDKTPEALAVLDGPRIVCCVCGEPCGIYSPICDECAKALSAVENLK